VQRNLNRGTVRTERDITAIVESDDLVKGLIERIIHAALTGDLAAG
jgi:hypothetical protein